MIDPIHKDPKVQALTVTVMAGYLRRRGADLDDDADVTAVLRMVGFTWDIVERLKGRAVEEARHKKVRKSTSQKPP